MNLTVVLLGLMISITLLLIVILLLVLRFMLKKFLSKPPTHPASSSAMRQRQAAGGTRGARIMRTQLDPDVPYALTAPPSYGDTIVADRRMQTPVGLTEDEESNLILEDVL